MTWPLCANFLHAAGSASKYNMGPSLREFKDRHHSNDDIQSLRLWVLVYQDALSRCIIYHVFWLTNFLIDPIRSVNFLTDPKRSINSFFTYVKRSVNFLTDSKRSTVLTDTKRLVYFFDRPLKIGQLFFFDRASKVGQFFWPTPKDRSIFLTGSKTSVNFLTNPKRSVNFFEWPQKVAQHFDRPQKGGSNFFDQLQKVGQIFWPTPKCRSIFFTYPKKIGQFFDRAQKGSK